MYFMVKNMHKKVIGQGTHKNQLYKLQCITKLNTKEHTKAIDLGDSNTELKAKEYIQVVGHGK